VGYLTKYGDFWGRVPQSSGRIFWVAPSASYTVEGRAYSASDDNDGLSPERALLTLNQAISNATTAVGDVIVLLPGAHSWSVTATISKSVTITGIPCAAPLSTNRMAGVGSKARTSITTSGTVHVLTVTAADVEIAYLHIIPVATKAGIAPSAAADRMFVHDCTFAVTTAADTATMGIDVTFTTTASSLDDVVVRNCFFFIRDNQGPMIRLGATCTEMLIEQCTFKLSGSTSMDDCIESPLAGNTGLTIRDCDFLQSSTAVVYTDAVDTTGSTTDGSVSMLRCYFAVGSDPIEDTNVADMQVAENYILTGAASTGGTLVLGT
jgi:hypothetical protein